MAENTSEKPVVNLRPGGHGPGGPHGKMGMPQEKAKDVKGTLKRIVSYIGRNKGILFTMLAVMLMATILNVVAPSFIANAIDAVTVTDGHPADISALMKWLCVLAVVYLLNGI
ncbi:MAG: hypothetical protein ACI4Q4_08830, partial [Oscillospiraceae bacterium]